MVKIYANYNTSSSFGTMGETLGIEVKYRDLYGSCQKFLHAIFCYMLQEINSKNCSPKKHSF